jgi:hypothetical protein
MAPQRPMKLVFKKSEQGAPIDLLESLSESRISVLYLARQAKEAKNNSLAKELTAKGQSLRKEIERVRRTVTADLDKETKTIIAQAGAAQAQLAKLIQNAEKSSKKIAVFARARSAVSNILALAKRVI